MRAETKWRTPAQPELRRAGTGLGGSAVHPDCWPRKGHRAEPARWLLLKIRESGLPVYDQCHRFNFILANGSSTFQF